MAALARSRSIKPSARLARLALLLALGSLWACAEPRPESSTNVLLITVDTLRADHLGSHGFRIAAEDR